MDVYEAVTSRRAVRGFTDQPVPNEVLERVLCRRGLVAVRIEPPTLAHLRGDRRAAGAAQECSPSSGWQPATPGTSGSSRCIRPN